MPIKGKILSTFPIEISVAAIGKNKNVFWSVCPSILIYRPLLFISGLFCSVSFCLFTFCFFGFWFFFVIFVIDCWKRWLETRQVSLWTNDPNPFLALGAPRFWLFVRDAAAAAQQPTIERKERKKKTKAKGACCIVCSLWREAWSRERPP